ncbi:MAG: hypothetical protein AB7S99_04985 [Pseudodonghicola sp.]
MPEVLSQLYQLLLPTALSAISTVLGLVLLRLSATAKERWGIEIEARLRETLHSALMTGISMAASKGLKGDDAIKAAVGHVITKGAPAAVDYFGLDLKDLAEMAGGKLHNTLSATLATSVAGEMPWEPNTSIAAPSGVDQVIR